MKEAQKIIVYLFAKGEPVSKAAVQKNLEFDEGVFSTALTDAKQMLEACGLSLVDDGKELELRTSAQASELVEKIRKDEFSREIGKAGIETLSIVLYRGPASRSEIDYIRGVNSSHILRSLSMRGLLRRVPHPKDDRSFVYEPTTELLGHFGVASVKDLPEYESVTAEIKALEDSAAEVDAKNAEIETSEA